MPHVAGEVNLFAELRLRRANGESAPVKEHHCEVTDIADTWTCTTWVDLTAEEADNIEYDVHWEDRANVPRGSKGRLIVDGEPVGQRYINPDKEDYKGIVDYHRMDEMHCARLEFAKIQTTNETGPNVRQLTPMAGTVKLELELGWFVPETRPFGGNFKRINSEHPLFDARPVNVQEVARNAVKGLTHTSKFGQIFARPFKAPPGGPPPKFVVAPPPFRNGFNGGEARRPFAEFFWIVGYPDHLANPPQNPVNMAMKTDGQDQFNPYGSDYNHQYPEAQPMFVPPQVDRARSLSQTPYHQTPPPPSSSYNQQNGNGRAQSSQPDGGWGGGTPVASGSGGHGQNGGAGWQALKEEPSDVKPSAANPSIWTNTNLTAIDLTLDEDDDDDDDDEVEDVVMTSGVPSRSAGIAASRPPSKAASLPPPSEAGESVRSGQTTGTTGRLYPPQEDWMAPPSNTTAVDPDFPPLSTPSSTRPSSVVQPQKKTIPAQYKVPTSPATTKRPQSEALFAPASPEASSEVEQTILKRPRVDSEASRTAVSDAGDAASIASFGGGGGSSSQWEAESTAASSQAGDQERPWEFQKSKKQKQPQPPSSNGNGNVKPTSYASSVASSSTTSSKRPLKLPKAPLVAPGQKHPNDLEDGEEEEPAFEFEGGQVVSSTSAPGGVLAQAEAARRSAEEKNRREAESRNSGRSSSATGGGAGGSVGVGGGGKKVVVGAPGWSVVGNAEEVKRRAMLEERRRKEAEERDDGGWGI